jgi:hypothetical protein
VSPFQAVKTWKTSTDPDYEAKKNRVLHLYAIADGQTPPGPADPDVVICMDEFGPLNLRTWLADRLLRAERSLDAASCR